MAGVTFDRVSKVYPDGTRAVNGLDLGDRGRRVHGARRAVGLRQDDRAADGRRARGRSPRASSGSASASSTTCPSRDRDIAMVFQSYALYPHLTRLREHRLRPAAEEAAEGGDRRARAEGGARRSGSRTCSSASRATSPAASGSGSRWAARSCASRPAFLMDEPLSNLDAKLRVQMRAEISRLQRDLGVTTIYVTHDQVEAMTMGDRVAVMRKGELQQVAEPQTLYDRPRQPLRRRLHRLAGDEHGRGDGRAPERRRRGRARRRRSSSSTRRRSPARPALAAVRGPRR